MLKLVACVKTAPAAGSCLLPCGPISLFGETLWLLHLWPISDGHTNELSWSKLCLIETKFYDGFRTIELSGFRFVPVIKAAQKQHDTSVALHQPTNRPHPSVGWLSFIRCRFASRSSWLSSRVPDLFLDETVMREASRLLVKIQVKTRKSVLIIQLHHFGAKALPQRLFKYEPTLMIKQRESGT